MPELVNGLYVRFSNEKNGDGLKSKNTTANPANNSPAATANHTIRRDSATRFTSPSDTPATARAPTASRTASERSSSFKSTQLMIAFFASGMVCSTFRAAKRGLIARRNGRMSSEYATVKNSPRNNANPMKRIVPGNSSQRSSNIAINV